MSQVNMKILLVGRHNGEIPGCTIVERRNVQFAATHQEVLDQLRGIVATAPEGVDAVVLQATPSQVAAALTNEALRVGGIAQGHGPGGLFGGHHELPIYAVVSVPGERPEAKTQEFLFDEEWLAKDAREQVLFANPNAKAEVYLHIPPGQRHGWGLRVTVDQPMRFQFSHLERLF